MRNVATQRTLTNEERDRRVLDLFEQLVELEQRLIPTGLHVFGRPHAGTQCADLLHAVASYDRPEWGTRALPDLVAEGLGLGPYQRLLERHDGSSLAERERVEELSRESVRRFVDAGCNSAATFLREAAGVKEGESRKIFERLEGLRASLSSNQELDSLARALRGEYVLPGPGADLVQNPHVLPTGRNTHAVNPYAIPSDAAFRRGQRLADLMLERHRAEKGTFPRAVALVLWGLDNIKTQGEGVAQALWLLGVRPVRDAMNRVTEVEPVSIEELGRPRVDVVMTVSGIFRDLFGATVELLDKAVRRVAQLKEPPESNFVRRNVLERMEGEGCAFESAALRVFSNAPGSYGTNVNFMVMDSQWEHADALGDLFVARKCFAYGRDARGGRLEGREARQAMTSALSLVEATYQNVDSFEIGITDVDHYFEYLGGLTKAVEKQSSARPAVYLSDALSRDLCVRSLEETVRLETRAKTLNPKWYEGMLSHGYRGVAEIESHVTNTFGWSATAGGVEDWIYTEVAETFVLDERMLERLRDLNPHSARQLVARLLEAEGRGFWEAGPELLGRLREVFSSIEDQLEGVT